MPTKASAAKKRPLTLGQLASYDDILTDALVDHVRFFHVPSELCCLSHISRPSFLVEVL